MPSITVAMSSSLKTSGHISSHKPHAVQSSSTHTFFIAMFFFVFNKIMI